MLERVLQGKRVDAGGQHAHVIPLNPADAKARAGQSAENIAAADNHANLHAEFVNDLQILRQLTDHIAIEAHPLLFVAENFSAEFEEDALVWTF